MVNNLYGKDILDLTEFTKQDVIDLIELAIDMKANKEKYAKSLDKKTLAMIFEKNSTRTRISFEVGMYELGGYPLFLDSSTTQMGRGEPIYDTAHVLSGYVDAIMIRTFSDELVAQLAEHARIPVINGLTDLHHPCQILADFQTIYEVKGSLEGLKITYIGDGNNMAHSYLIGAAIVGIDVSIAAPNAYMPNTDIVEIAKNYAKTSGSIIEIVEDPKIAVKNADFIFTDVWSSMGNEDEASEREQVFKEIYQVNTELVALAKSDYHFMHCLPAHRGEEVSSEIIDGSHSLIYQEAENRLHAQKALLHKVLLP